MLNIKKLIKKLNIKKFLGLTYYTSELDQFLVEFDKKHAKLSTSQRKEKEKYARIYQLRDEPHLPLPRQNFWEKF